MLHTVMFLCEKREDPKGNVAKFPAATAFLVLVASQGSVWKYLVTARHNIDCATDPIFVRHNLRSGDFGHLKTLQDEWTRPVGRRTRPGDAMGVKLCRRLGELQSPVQVSVICWGW